MTIERERERETFLNDIQKMVQPTSLFGKEDMRPWVILYYVAHYLGSFWAYIVGQDPSDS